MTICTPFSTWTTTFLPDMFLNVQHRLDDKDHEIQVHQFLSKFIPIDLAIVCSFDDLKKYLGKNCFPLWPTVNLRDSLLLFRACYANKINFSSAESPFQPMVTTETRNSPVIDLQADIAEIFIACGQQNLHPKSKAPQLVSLCKIDLLTPQILWLIFGLSVDLWMCARQMLWLTVQLIENERSNRDL